LLKIILPLAFAVMAPGMVSAQYLLSGTVYDSSKINFVEGVRVVSTNGMFTVTDSMGGYHIKVTDRDSVYFSFRNKPTQKFAVKSISNPTQFDISLRVTVKGKYSTLKEVVVYSRSYRQDSIENRKTYADVFGYRNPGVRSSITPDGMVGADLDELINIFRFKRNKELRAFRARLEDMEQDRYVNYRFNKTLVRRITQLDGTVLDDFMMKYRPTYPFVKQASEISFNQYILNASYDYRKSLQKKDDSKNMP
jgi:hypothetical protein